MIISYQIEWFNVNRKIAISAIMIAFVGGMIFAGTPVEAAQGGVGVLIDELWLAINALDGRVADNESDISGHETRITSLENNPNTLNEIMRIDGGRDTSINLNEVYFLDGDGITKNTASDFELASKMVGIDGTITEVQYKIGKAIRYGDQATARLYKNNIEVGSCNLLTSTSSHTSCTMNMNEPVVKSDLLAMSDVTSASTRIDIEGKSAFVSITP